ncbi:hypothetical protein BU16DRAFT_560217 [Lophium mytilinum]|uniref:Uncharacterized protein n=1 Tax=Lophium mytilinum TaxID=390894 RepID=A0A6A6QYR1_9PEZI|nr:hypothetical protein BU16DRAFT_560217 [Lophium mytilinum]
MSLRRDEHSVYLTKTPAKVIELGWILLDAKGHGGIMRPSAAEYGLPPVRADIELVHHCHSIACEIGVNNMRAGKEVGNKTVGVLDSEAPTNTMELKSFCIPLVQPEGIVERV